ncbi:RNA pol II transcription cofactor [Podospora pseudopauciseta]|uniref:RNA pol II transcription cofactor n=1 Tax=Podospora pseudopauciseta TaxID=2093780 RepID=A0ABR0HG70_9PEZI|nr:RNA pol II transcription cofactor [Podospora pseudopauciseta]
MKTFSWISSLTVVLVSVLFAYFYTTNPAFELERIKNIDIPASLDILRDNIKNYLNLTSATPSSDISSPPPTTTTTVITPAQLATMSRITLPRRILKTLLAKQQSEGAGATVRRSIGTPSLRSLNPFLMLDHFSVSPGAGFPDHPHRGQETITYLLTGGMDHEDFAGNRGTLNPGDLQFMTAGKGIMHAEMPRQNPDGSPNIGLQLWVDLPKELKYCEPRYRDLKAEEIPTVITEDGKVKIKVISGKSYGVESLKDLAYTPVVFYDVEVQPGGKIEQEVPQGWQGFAYILEGADITFSDGPQEEKKVSQWHNVVFGNGKEEDGVVARVEETETKPGRFVLVAGQMMDQPVVQYGPFVLNSQEEVYQAFVDYQSHTNGFERAKGWRSEIGKSMVH